MCSSRCHGRFTDAVAIAEDWSAIRKCFTLAFISSIDWARRELINYLEVVCQFHSKHVHATAHRPYQWVNCDLRSSVITLLSISGAIVDFASFVLQSAEFLGIRQGKCPKWDHFMKIYELGIFGHVTFPIVYGVHHVWSCRYRMTRTHFNNMSYKS